MRGIFYFIFLMQRRRRCYCDEEPSRPNQGYDRRAHRLVWNLGFSRTLAEGMTGGNPSYGHPLPVGGTRRNLSDGHLDPHIRSGSFSRAPVTPTGEPERGREQVRAQRREYTQQVVWDSAAPYERAWQELCGGGVKSNMSGQDSRATGLNGNRK